MKTFNITLVCIILLIAGAIKGGAQSISYSMVDDSLVFEENDGLVVVEAEYFHKQSMNDHRQWCITAPGSYPKALPDHDPFHLKGASNNAYIELLPDTRADHGDRLIGGENFSNEPGKAGVINYKVYFNTPGRYYVWVRAYSTGSEDNGIHVGLNGEWPESGLRMQWCEGKNAWHWESKQRTKEEHCGVPHQIYLDIEKPGVHDIHFSMREDGFEMDQWLMTKDLDFIPAPASLPVSEIKSGNLPEPFQTDIDVGTNGHGVQYLPAIIKDIDKNAHVFTVSDFDISGSNYYYISNKRFLAVEHEKDRQARGRAQYHGEAGEYDVLLLAVGQKGGVARYGLGVDGKHIDNFRCPQGRNAFDEDLNFTHVYENVSLENNSTIQITSTALNQGKILSRGIWSGIAIVPAGEGKTLQRALLRELKANIKPEITGELKKWHKVTFTFEGPDTSEDDDFNPFMNYRFNVRFIHKATGKSYLIPGYFAADGNAGETGATSGNKWRVHFAPDETGEWFYEADFRRNNWVAVSESEEPGNGGFFMNGASGTFVIADTDKSDPDFRARGRLQYTGERYLQFAETGEYFLKSGPDAPENLLSYADFDGTFHNDGHKDNLVKTWDAHVKDWKEGDPEWKDGKGKGLIGALNYIHSKGLNSVSFLTMNIIGDDQNVFPFVDYNTYDRFDVSKLDQWEKVFSHAQKLGVFLHFKIMEMENQGLLDNGGVGALSKLYYRELIARFGHHLALNWNLCEENGEWVSNHPTPPQFKEQRVAMTEYFHQHDPYNHHLVIHNGEYFFDLLGTQSHLTGPSIQTHFEDFRTVHHETLKWLSLSKEAGKQWAVAVDEPGDAGHALVPDEIDPEKNLARQRALWGVLMAGGWGTEWYFGYQNAHSDLTCEDWRSRDLFWDYCSIALDFWKNSVPFWEMENQNQLIGNTFDNNEKYCFAKEDELYLVYLAEVQTSTLDLNNASGNFEVKWFNPRTGGKMQTTKVKKVKGGSVVELGNPPVNDEKDWLVVVSKSSK
ncbi:DUF5060 domain-containing protein [Thermophagus sp. OGC60D27]|uniref:DUF5060 domain-containing protein n=1 Tax=Thermophagus sp. OGC60D27 TaxID=3458415 RepID=UPI0040377174